MSEITSSQFAFFVAALKEKAGISLNENKMYLLESRLTPLARKHGIADAESLLQLLQKGADATFWQDVVEAMTTNETSFFRDIKPFDNFKNTVMPHIKQRRSGGGEIVVWCAACSTGQEPYSLAMTWLENKHLMPGYSLKIIATDIDSKVIERAKKGIYTQFEVQRGLPIAMLMKYFSQDEAKADRWHLKPEVKDVVSFRTLNLLENYIAIGKCDVVFCRNVLIYFEPNVKAQILKKIAGVLCSGGALFLGSAETTTNLCDDFSAMEGITGVFSKE